MSYSSSSESFDADADAADREFMRIVCGGASMSEAELAEYHRRGCEEGDGWTHAFGVTLVDDQVARVELPAKAIVKLFTRQNWQKMADALIGSASLDHLDLSFCGMAEEGVVTLFGREWTGRRRLDCLALAGSPLGVRGLSSMLPFFRSMSALNEIRLCRANIDNEAARLLSEVLSNLGIESLQLRVNAIGDEGVEYLLRAASSANLVNLDLALNEYGSRGINAIAQFMEREDRALEKLSADCNSSDDASRMVGSISNNSKMKYMSLGSRPGDENHMTSVEPNLKQLVCDMSSFGSLCNSNHRLYYVGQVSDSNLFEALSINGRSKEGASTGQIVRSKLRSFYFQGAFDLQPFQDMNVKLMPHIFELVTKAELCADEKYYEVDSEDVNGIFRLVRNCHLPELYSFPSPDARIQELEDENARLKDQNERLTAELEELRASRFAPPSKRAKANNDI